MFSGIIEEVGIIKNMISTPTSKILTINCKKILNDTDVGDSISINGVCLTMTRKSNQEFDVDIVEETLRCTSLNKIEESFPPFFSIKNVAISILFLSEEGKANQILPSSASFQRSIAIL